MSQRYKGGVISATPPTTTGGTSGTAKGVWTLEQQLQAQASGVWPEVYVPTYIEDVFSTYLYTGNGSIQTITNNIDLSGKGGMLWIKSRSNIYEQSLFDTRRGTQSWLTSATTGAAIAYEYITAFNSNGFNVTTNSGSETNANNATYASWTFCKQSKFFDLSIVASGGGTVNFPNLGTIGCVIVKEIDQSGAWVTWHRSLSSGNILTLNTTSAQFVPGSGYTISVSGTTVTLGNQYTRAIVYAFAHDAGGFGLTGSDNVISCGSFTNNSTVNLGYEPQFVLIKPSSTIGNWQIIDNMRKWVGTDAASSSAEGGAYLAPNLNQAESTTAYNTNITSTGFKVDGITAGTYIYIAIRRGPMKIPTSGTSVFTPTARTGTGATATFTGAGFPVDLSIIKQRDQANSVGWEDRLRGSNKLLESSGTTNEISTTQFITSFASMNGYTLGANSGVNAASATYANWDFRRAPKFFDVVCDTGTGSAHTINHSLGAVPQLIIRKSRSTSGQPWFVYSETVGAGSACQLNGGSFSSYATAWNNTSPTSSVFTVGTESAVNQSNALFVTYLFASCPGVSKVGSYTGTGTTQQIDCGFTNGSRFVLIKRTNGAGEWYVWDSARGIVAGNDPYLLLDLSQAEVTNTDYVDTYSAGFELSSTAPAAINANGGTFIFLAIA